MPLRLAVRDIAFFERPVRFARPFHFGAVVIIATPQLFVRAEIEIEGKGRFVGATAELLVPKWFDKRPELSPDDTVAELRRNARGMQAERRLETGMAEVDVARDQQRAAQLGNRIVR